MSNSDAYNLLEKLGFTNISNQPIRDLVTGWIKKDGSIEKVAIGELDRFKENSKFDFDTRISIEYHTYKNK